MFQEQIMDKANEKKFLITKKNIFLFNYFLLDQV